MRTALKRMQRIWVRITEQDGQRWWMEVLASGTTAACMIVQHNLGRIVKLEAWAADDLPPEAA